jgi:hypothetical protein
LAARSWDFLSLPNCAPELFVHARRHVFVVRIRDVFAYRLRVLEAVTANTAMPFAAGKGVRAPLGAFRVVLGHRAFSTPVKATAIGLARMLCPICLGSLEAGYHRNDAPNSGGLTATAFRSSDTLEKDNATRRIEDGTTSMQMICLRL